MGEGADFVASWIENLLKEANKSTCGTSLSFMLVGKEGAPYIATAFSRDRFFTSCLFTIGWIDEKRCCAELDILIPSCCGNKLFRTEARILVNLTCFCGIDFIDTPIFDCLQVSYVIKDRICLPFMLTKKNSPKVLYTINPRTSAHVETISIHYTGPDPEVEVLVQTREKVISLQVPKDGFRSVTVLNLKTIEIATPIEAVHGTVEIHHTFCEKKNIYY